MRNGLWLSGSAFRLGLSSEFGVGWAEGASSPSFAWPFDLGLDLRLMLPPSPFQVSLLAMSQLSPLRRLPSTWASCSACFSSAVVLVR